MTTGRERGGLKIALAISLIAHALFMVWMHQRPAPPERVTLDVIELVDAPPTPDVVLPVPEPVVAPPPAVTTKPNPRVAPKAVTRPAAPVGTDTVLQPGGSPGADAPQADPLDRPVDRPSLLPSIGAISLPTPEAPRGRTLRPDDPSLNPSAVAAREKALVTGRVIGWSEDVLAEARAQGGLPHPYFTEVRDAARAGLTKLALEKGVKPAPGAAAQQLAARYSESASSYAKTGNPNLGPVGEAPRLSERLTQPEQAPMRALAQATETIQDLSHGRPLLTLTLDVRQPKQGAASVVVLKASIDRAFDSFVVESWSSVTAAAGPPPESAFRSDVLRSVWEVEGWPKVSNKAAADLLPDVMGISVAQLTATDAYEFRAKLLRVY